MSNLKRLPGRIHINKGIVKALTPKDHNTENFKVL